MAKKFSVRIGINPISWTNDDLPSLGRETPLQTILTEGRKIGYEGFELGGKFPTNPKELHRVLFKHHLDLVSGWYSGMLSARSAAAEIKAAESHLERLSVNGAKVMVYGEVGGSIQGRINEPLYKRPRFRSQTEWKEYAERLNIFAAHTLSKGIRLAYHHHMGAYVQSPEDVDTLMSLTNQDVGLLFDTGHITFAGGDPVQVLKKHLSRVCHVHVKDVRASVMQLANNRCWSFLQAVLNGIYTVPGDGCVDFKSVIKLLKSHGYKGWIVVEAEQDPVVAPSYTYAKLGYQTIHQLIKHK